MNTIARIPNIFQHFYTNLLTILLPVCLLTACLDIPGIEKAGEDVGKGIEEVGEGVQDVADAAETASKTAAEIAAETMNTTQEIAQKTLDALAAAIATLDQNSAEWQQVLKDLQAQMTRDVQSTLRTEVTTLLETSIAAVGVEFRCNTDFVGDRVKEQLLRIQAKLIKAGTPVFQPRFCDPVPAIIPIQEVMENRVSALHIYGYNFDTIGPMQVWLVDDNRRVEVTSAVQHPSSYIITINLGSNGVPLTRESDKLVITWNGRELYTIGVVQPYQESTPTPTPTATSTPTPTRTPSATPTATPLFRQGAFHFYRFRGIQNGQSYDTGLSADGFECGLAGYQATDGDYQENGIGDLLIAKAQKMGGTWRIEARLRTETDIPGVWSVTMLCIDTTQAGAYQEGGVQGYRFFSKSAPGDVVDAIETGVNAHENICGVVGMEARGGDIYELGSVEVLVQAYAFEEDDEWMVRADFASHNADETWTVNILCLPRNPQAYMLPDAYRLAEGDNTFDTGIGTDQYICGVFGFEALNGDLDEDVIGNLFVAYLEPDGGHWVIHTDFVTERDVENWVIQPVCINTSLAEYHP